MCSNAHGGSQPDGVIFVHCNYFFWGGGILFRPVCSKKIHMKTFLLSHVSSHCVIVEHIRDTYDLSKHNYILFY
jgi:hypothetical protein